MLNTADATNGGFEPEKRRTLSKILGGSAIFAQAAHASSESAAKPEAQPGHISVVKDENGRYQRKHTGTGIDVLWEGKLCIHARYCMTGSPAVFTPDIKWHPDKDSVDNLAHVIRKCPSGALKYLRKDGGPQEPAPAVNLLRTGENGPLTVNADMEIVGVTNALRATLCRCGHSGNKPFCDGSHIRMSFKATGEPAATNELEIPVRRHGRLQIRPLTDGPYQVLGPLELCAMSGKPLARTVRTILCRCGQSEAKPFCDSACAATGFKAPGVDPT